MAREPKDWITVNGNHIPLFDGESKQDALNRFISEQNEQIKSKQIAKNKEIADKLNGKIDFTKKTDDGQTAKDGSITMEYCHISNKTGNFGSQYGQDIEPSGEYMTYIPEGTPRVKASNYTYGNIHFSKPLIMEHKSTGANGWKKDLSEKYGGKRGKALSNAIKKDGYDAVVTYEIYKGNKSWVEIVNLNGRKG